MTKRHVHIYEGVAVPYEQVRHMLRDHPDDLLQLPLEAGLHGFHEAMTQFETDVGKLHLAKDVVLDITDFIDVPGPIPLGRMQLRFGPADHSKLFPVGEADLEVEPIDPKRTMVSLLASYTPPFGPLGALLDRFAMHEVAEHSLGSFFDRLRHRIVEYAHSEAHEEAETPVLAQIRATHAGVQ